MSSRWAEVFDNNIVISALLQPNSLPARLLEGAIQRSVLVTTPDILEELRKTLLKSKFDRYASPEDREAFVERYTYRCTIVEVSDTVTDCRDPKDNMSLALAQAAHAKLILTGDADLLTLHPWRTIPILTPAAYLVR